MTNNQATASTRAKDGRIDWRPERRVNRRIRSLKETSGRKMSSFMDEAAELLLMRYSDTPIIVRLGKGGCEVLPAIAEQ